MRKARLRIKTPNYSLVPGEQHDAFIVRFSKKRESGKCVTRVRNCFAMHGGTTNFAVLSLPCCFLPFLRKRFLLCLFAKMVDDHWAARHDRNKVDLAFIVDCTGSMGPHIKQAQKHVRNIAETVARTAFNVKLGLVEYRDHPPQDNSFITKVHDFTHSLDEMKRWVDGMSARGGGDGPESVACALEHAATKLHYRKDATKICVLIGKLKLIKYCCQTDTLSIFVHVNVGCSVYTESYLIKMV